MSVSLSSKSIQLVGVIPFYTNHATYVGASISLGVAASKTKPSYDWYVGYAGMVITQAPDNWRANMSDTEVADLYFNKLRNFPHTFSNYAVPNADLMGWQPRQRKGGRGHDIDPRKHGICLDGLVNQS